MSGYSYDTPVRSSYVIPDFVVGLVARTSGMKMIPSGCRCSSKGRWDLLEWAEGEVRDAGEFKNAAVAARR